MDVSGAREAGAIAAALTALSKALWATYADEPPKAMLLGPGGIPMENEKLQNQADMEAVTRRADLIANLDVHLLGRPEPHMVAYGALQRAADRLRDATAHEEASFRLAVAAEAKEEAASVGDAEAGTYTGRAVQALALSRSEPIPSQVQAVWEHLRTGPAWDFSPLEAVDATSAAYALSFWCDAAFAIIDESVDGELLDEADDASVSVLEVGTLLGLIDAGLTPGDAALELIRQAKDLAQGHYPTLGIDDVELFDPREEFTDRACALDTEIPAIDLVRSMTSFLVFAALHTWRTDGDHGVSEPETDEYGEVIDPDAEEQMLQSIVELLREQVAADLAEDYPNGPYG